MLAVLDPYQRLKMEIAVERFVLWVGRAAGLLGLVLVAVGAIVRLAGSYWLGGFQAGTLLLAGIASMTFGCFCMLNMLTQRAR